MQKYLTEISPTSHIKRKKEKERKKKSPNVPNPQRTTQLNFVVIGLKGSDWSFKKFLNSLLILCCHIMQQNRSCLGGREERGLSKLNYCFGSSSLDIYTSNVSNVPVNLTFQMIDHDC